MNEGTTVKDERGHLYRVLPTEPTLRKSLLLRVQPLRQWKDGSYHSAGGDRIIDEKFVRPVAE